ncbi:DUF7503 family protein [Halomarina ordinaria]|uniref:Uncharacterized protein n=1 Tax=Halomarina ordinaria TaxID=3033939 RepID=A0ABD5U8E8_9EURY|nr:hypothetical protein [Halomarina sp. PSRA2]
MSDNAIAAYLAEHPKMTGVLFSALLLLSQAGSALAAKGGATPGP